MKSSLPQRQITVAKLKMRSPKNDAVYWRSKPYVERLAALESIRQDFFGWKYGAQPEFQRVYTVLKR
jgi:hypothetical protein